MREQALDTPHQESIPHISGLTKRIMIVSPLPQRVNHMLIALSNANFDLFCIHELDEGLLRALKPNLLLYDGLPLTEAELTSEALQRDQQQLCNVADAGIPVIVLLDRLDYIERDRLELKNSEYLLWPLEIEELMSRIQDVLHRHMDSLISLQNLLLFKDLKIDVKRMIVTRDNERIELTKTEYDLLLHFLNSDGSVQSRELLLDVIWGLQFYGGSNVVDVHIKSLRKKLNDSPVDPKYIVTVRGVGYRVAE